MKALPEPVGTLAVLREGPNGLPLSLMALFRKHTGPTVQGMLPFVFRLPRGAFLIPRPWAWSMIDRLSSGLHRVSLNLDRRIGARGDFPHGTYGMHSTLNFFSAGVASDFSALSATSTSR